MLNIEETLHDDWSAMEASVGSGAGIPDLLRVIRIEREPEQVEAIKAVRNLVEHQGTVFEVAPSVVRVFLRMLEEASIANRHLLLTVLQLVAVPCCGDYLPFEFCSAEFKTSIAEKARVSSGRHARTYESTLSCYTLVEEQVPLLCKLLNNKTTDISVATSHLLAWVPGNTRQSHGTFEELLGSAETLSERRVASLALGYGFGCFAAGRRFRRNLVVKFLDSESALLRTAAAISLAYNTRPTGAVLRALREAAGNCDLESVGAVYLPFGSGWLRQYSSEVLEAVSDK